MGRHRYKKEDLYFVSDKNHKGEVLPCYIVREIKGVSNAIPEKSFYYRNAITDNINVDKSDIK